MSTTPISDVRVRHYPDRLQVSALVDLGVPMEFASPIADRWWVPGQTIITAIICTSRSERSWLEVGRQLLRGLSGTPGRVGAILEGQFPVNVLTEWISLTNTPDSVGSSQLTVMSFPHPVIERRFTLEMHWEALYPDDHPSIIPRVFELVGSEYFLRSCECIIVSMDQPEQGGNEFTAIMHAPIDVARAREWIVPLDYGLGFIAGLRRGTCLERTLAISEALDEGL